MPRPQADLKAPSEYIRPGKFVLYPAVFSGLFLNQECRLGVWGESGFLAFLGVGNLVTSIRFLLEDPGREGCWRPSWVSGKNA